MTRLAAVQSLLPVQHEDIALISPQDALDTTLHFNLFILFAFSSSKHIHAPALIGGTVCVYRQTEDCDSTAGTERQIADDSFSVHFFLKDNHRLCDLAASFQFRSRCGFRQPRVELPYHYVAVCEYRCGRVFPAG